MKTHALLGLLLALLVLSFAAQADEHVCVSGNKYSASIAFGGPKVRFNGYPGTYEFLRTTPPVDATTLAEWLLAAYVEGDEYAGFSNCPIECSHANRCPCDGSLGCPPAAEAQQAGGFPGIESTYEGVRIAIAAGAFTNCFWYDKFAAYARSVLADPTATVENLTAACRLLEIVTGFKEADRLAVSRQVESRMTDMGNEIDKLPPLLDAALLPPTPPLRAALQGLAQGLVQTLQAPRVGILLELAHLQHILGQDSPIAAETISDSVLTLYASSGGFRSDGQTGYADLRSTFAALEALELAGGLMRVDADAVRQYILDCWVSPGFASVSPYDDTDIGVWTCTDLQLTYAGTEALAILENRDVPER